MSGRICGVSLQDDIGLGPCLNVRGWIEVVGCRNSVCYQGSGRMRVDWECDFLRCRGGLPHDDRKHQDSLVTSVRRGAIG